MCFKYIILLCLIYNIPTTNSIGNEPTELEKYETIEEWSSNLELATDINWGELMAADNIDENFRIEAALFESKCPPDILRGLLENSNVTKWPIGLSTLCSRLANRHIMKTFVCRRLPGINAVVMLHFENPMIPEEMKAEPGLLFIYQTKTKHKQIEEWSSKLELATDINWGELLAADKQYDKFPIEAALIESKCPPDILKGLLKNSNITKWPLGLSTLRSRLVNRHVMYKHKCRRIPGVNAVVMLHFENPRVLKNMKAEPGLLFIYPAMTPKMEKYKKIKEWSSNLEVATDINWGELIAADNIYENFPIEAALIESKCPPDILKSLLENSNITKWPLGLSTLQTRLNNRHIMKKYKCRPIPGVNAVVMLHFENPTIPEEMKAEPGLLFIFKKTITELEKYIKIKEWSSNLEVVTDINWGELIAADELYNKFPIETALFESKCPPDILKSLLENSNVTKWPLGLSTLQTRLSNRHIMDKFICRRLPGVNALVMLHFENPTIPEEMKAEPGLLFIFKKTEITWVS